MDPILKAHAAAYPLWQSRDVIKLMYQRELGCGHFAPSAEFVRAHLEGELSAVAPSSGPLLEPVGGAYVRLNLAPAKAAGISPSLLVRLFLASAKAPEEADLARFRQALQAVDPADCGLDAGALHRAVTDFLTGDLSPVSHSERYRAAYAPHYRVLSATLCHYLPLLMRVEALLAEKGRAVIAVDGRSGSGKSTFAECLRVLWGAAVIHMDDFFLPMARKTPERLMQPGGNVDIERFAAEVLPGLQAGQVAYQPYSCKLGTLGERQTLPASSLTVVEGAYALHPGAPFPYDLTCFFTLTPEEQQARILRRNGPEMLQRFQKEWIPLEEKYIDAMQLAHKVDVCFDAGRGAIL